MKKVFIVHGWEASSESNWFPWLVDVLKEKGFKALALDMPNSAHPNKNEWIETLQEVIPDEDEVVLIGHSLGVPAILGFLEQANRKLKIFKSILVSGFSEPLGIAEEPDSFVRDGFDFKKIKDNCSEFVIYHSDNDPYIPLEMAYDLEKELDGELTVIPNAGHLNSGTGYFEFSEILKSILN